jgi:hypothetical protein
MAIDQPQSQGLVSEEKYQAALAAPEVEKDTRTSNIVSEEEIAELEEDSEETNNTEKNSEEAVTESDSDDQEAKENNEAVQDSEKTAEESKEEEINRVVTKRLAREARKIQALQQEIENLRTGKSATQAPYIPNEPTLDQFGGDTQKFLQVRDQWVIQQHEAQTQAVRAQQEAARVANTYRSRVEQFATKHPDFVEKVSSPDLVPTPEVNTILLESEVGPDMAYYLADHPEELDRINDLPSHRRILEMGKLESKFLAPKKVAPKVNRPAPAPISPVKGLSSVTTTKALSKMSNAEFIAYRNAQELAKRKR